MIAQLFCDTCGAANQLSGGSLAGARCAACGELLQKAVLSRQAGTIPVAGSLTPGQLLRLRYRIVSQIGIGGFGAVYKAEDGELGNRLVAIKEMSENGLNPQERIKAVEAFKREALMLAALTHPNLPRIHDHFSEAGHWYLVMDFIEGETLAEHTCKAAGGHLPLEEVLQIGIQLCKVLGYLHTRQPPIIFRDLKPDNVMLTSDGDIYLIDFGIARHFKTGQTKDTIPFGSPGYAPPEQYGKTQTTPAADIYSLGATLHYLLTGNDPSTTPFTFAPFPTYGELSIAELEKLIMHMVEMDASKRPASIPLIKQELQRVAALEFTQGSSSTPSFPQPGQGAAHHQPGKKAQRVPQSAKNSPQTIGTLLYTHTGHTQPVVAVAWSPNNQRIASASYDGTVQIWDATTGQHLLVYREHSQWANSLAWSPTGTQIASGGEDKTVQVWHDGSGIKLLSYRRHAHFLKSGRVNAVAWSPDGKYIASASADKTAQVWHAVSGGHVFTYDEHDSEVLTLAWSPDSKYIASAGVDGIVQVWDALTGALQANYTSHKAGIYAVAWSPNGSHIASASADETIQIWRAFSGKHVLTYSAHSDVIYTLAWAPSGTRVVSAGGGGTVHIWSATSGNLLYTYRNHLGIVYAVSWSPDGSRIASASADETVQVWQAT